MTDDLPLPLERVSEEEALRALFGAAGPTPTTAFGCAYLWLQALSHLNEPTALEDLRFLSYTPDRWDFKTVASQLRGWSVMQNVEHPEGHNEIAYVKALRSDEVSRGFGTGAEIPSRDLQWLTLVGGSPQWWVWGVHLAHDRPEPGEILS